MALCQVLDLNPYLATPDILSEPAPFVLQTALNDFYVAYELKAYTKHPDKMLDIY